MSQEQMDSPLLRNSTASRIVDSIFEVVKRSEVVIVGRSTCEHTIGARMLLDEFGISHEDIDIDRFAAYDEVKEMMTSRTKGHDTTPWVFRGLII